MRSVFVVDLTSSIFILHYPQTLLLNSSPDTIPVQRTPISSSHSPPNALEGAGCAARFQFPDGFPALYCS